ncbi:MAG: cytochrome c-type biogenesis protein CcmH [Gemmatimonadaceae bacterium]
MRRREFLLRAIAGSGGVLLGTRALAAQQTTPAPAAGAPQSSGSSNLFDMNQGAAKRVVRPPKSGARASLSDDERDAVEHQIRCQCGCTLDVYVCRTTDFSCQVSPAMHRDVVALVEGGHSAQEIIDAFVDTYGEVALMAPKREGFNWAGYLVPFGALAAGGAALVTVLRRMQQRTAHIASPASGRAPGAGTPSLGTADELARLDAAIRRDD